MERKKIIIFAALLALFIALYCYMVQVGTTSTPVPAPVTLPEESPTPQSSPSVSPSLVLTLESAQQSPSLTKKLTDDALSAAVLYPPTIPSPTVTTPPHGALSRFHITLDEKKRPMVHYDVSR